MDGDKDFWYCVKHRVVEQGPGCRGTDRLGPYRTRQEAERALETVRRRNEEWDAAD